MPTLPSTVPYTGTSIEVLNAIKNSASQNYKDFVPYAQPNAESIKAIGSVIMQDPSLQNEFLNNLINRIGRVIITSKLYENPLAIFKQGILNFGETVEEIFTELAKPHDFDPVVAETERNKREIPDVRAAFHLMNFQKFYKITVQKSQLSQAFLSVEGVNTLLRGLITSVYTAANYDEFVTTKYLISKHILAGHIYPVSIPAVNSANMKDIVSKIKSISNAMTFLSTNYNLAGVHTQSLTDNQFIMLSSDFDAKMDVEVLASAFNMAKADFLGHRLLIDNFGASDTKRLDELFSNDASYKPLTDEEQEALNAIPAILIDRDFLQIYDNSIELTNDLNGQGRYWNYWYHKWSTFSISPFKNNALFVGGVPSVTAIAISPTTVATPKGSKVTFTPTLTVENFAPQTVNYTIDGANSNDTKITNGVLTIATDETATTITVTATSTYDVTKTAEATITIS